MYEQHFSLRSIEYTTEVMSNWQGKKIHNFIDNLFKDLQKNNKLIFLCAYKIVHMPLYEVVAFLLAHLDYVRAPVPLLF